MTPMVGVFVGLRYLGFVICHLRLRPTYFQEVVEFECSVRRRKCTLPLSVGNRP